MTEEFAYPLVVTRTRRQKTASIRVVDGIVKVTVPRTLSDRHVREFIWKSDAWIQKKLQLQAECPVPQPKNFVSGEIFPFLGEPYRLRVVQGVTSSVNLQNNKLIVTVCEEANGEPLIKSLLENWYLTQARDQLRAKTQRYARTVGVTPASVTVKSYKARWGSCSVRGDLSFNWRLILAPHHIVDYVVIHELCHLLEHNHSPRFWQLVSRHVPGWKGCRAWLKVNHLSI